MSVGIPLPPHSKREEVRQWGGEKAAVLMISFLYFSNFKSEYGFTRTLTKTTPFSCRPRMLFMRRAFPMLFSYCMSSSWAMSMPAAPAEGVAMEKP